MKIILLTGLPKTQKTTTLNLVYQQLTQNIQNPPPKQPIPNAPTSDFQCILNYKNKKVAIFSMGDTLYRIYEAIIFYSNIVDVLIIAHSQGGSVKNHLPTYMQSYCSQHYVIQKTKNNIRDCQNIVSNI